MTKKITWFGFLKRNKAIIVVPAILAMLIIKDPIVIISVMAIYVLVLASIGFVRSDGSD